jgi:hypothetical protein
VSFNALPHAHWPAIAAVLPLPWPREAAMMDLRYHAAEHAIYSRTLPEVRALAAAWGWSKSAVDRLIRGGAWVDEARPWVWRNAQRDSSGTEVGQQRDPANGQTPNTDESRDNSGTEVGQQRDSRAIHTGSPITHHQDQEPPKAPLPGGEPDPTPPTPVAPPVVEPTPPKPDPDELRLYGVLHGHQPRRSPTPTADARKALRRLLAEAGSYERACLYLAWVHTSLDEWACQLRGAAPWPGGSVQARWSPEELARNLGGRLDRADAWDAAGRPTTHTTEPRPAPRAGAPPGRTPTATGGLVADVLGRLRRAAPEPIPPPNRLLLTGESR